MVFVRYAEIFMFMIALALKQESVVQAFPTGAGIQACSTLVPLHGVDPQTTTSPYQLDVQGTTYLPGSLVVVTLSQVSGQGGGGNDNFRGLLLQGRSENTNEPVGQWLIAPDEENYRFLDCGDNFVPMSSLTHTNNDDKSIVQPIEFIWIAPQTNVGNVRFFGTIVQQFNIFWTGISTAQALQFDGTVGIAGAIIPQA